MTCWDASAEKLVTQLEGAELNSELGYDDAIIKSKWM